MTTAPSPVICAAYKVFNGELYLPWSLRALYDAVDHIVIFVSTRPWNGPIVPVDGTEAAIRAFPDPERKIRCVVADFRRMEQADSYANELAEMNDLLDYVRAQLPEVTHYLYVDADEIHTRQTLGLLRGLMAGMPQAGQFHLPWRCYWKSFRYWIDPKEPGQPMVAFRVTPGTRFTGIRNTNMPVPMLSTRPGVFLHHFSYALTTALVEQKIQAWSHCSEVVPGWLDAVWRAWDHDRNMEGLHPTRPWHFKRAVLADAAALPAIMRTHPYYGVDIA